MMTELCKASSSLSKAHMYNLGLKVDIRHPSITPRCLARGALYYERACFFQITEVNSADYVHVHQCYTQGHHVHHYDHAHSFVALRLNIRRL